MAKFSPFGALMAVNDAIDRLNFAYNDSTNIFKVSLETKDQRAIAVSGANADLKEAEDSPVGAPDQCRAGL